MVVMTASKNPFAARPLAAAAVLGALALAGAPRPLAAKDGTVNELSRHLESIEVGPATEHRLLVVHPLQRAVAAPPAGQAPVRLATGAGADTLALGHVAPGVRVKIEAVNLVASPTALLPGDLVRTAYADYAVVRPVLALEASPAEVQATRVSREVAPEPHSGETVYLGPVLPSALRYVALLDSSASDLHEACRGWAAELHLDTARASPAEFLQALKIASRAADYRARLLPFVQPPAGREIVGCAVLVDGAVAAIESFADPRRFAAAWPRLVDAMAVEASRIEMLEGLIADDAPPSADPDRFVTDVKDRLLSVYGAKPAVRDVRASGAEWVLPIDGTATRATFAAADRLVHFVLVTDPSRRGERRTGEETDPGVLERKARLTEAEKRWLERRKKLEPPVPAPPPVPSPR
jgi:hypothetical protein